MTDADTIIKELATAFFALKSGTKIERTKGNKKITIKVEKKKVEEM